MSVDTIRLFAISKLGWIKQQQRKLREQERETPREFLCRESHYVWGKRHLLAVIEADVPPSIELKHNHMMLRVRPESYEAKRQQIVEDGSRAQVKAAAAALIANSEPKLALTLPAFYLHPMKTP